MTKMIETYTDSFVAAPRASRLPITAVFLRAITAGMDVLFEWQRRSSDRNHLQTLDDHLLADIGLTRADVDSESRKRFWQA
ncbi:MAG: DUF1127 domain-containing protein [Minwuiales bacterium]|nr:DUF1127 domain-containing protein [Minwuiales bacterium]